MKLKCVFYNPLFLPVKIAGSPIEKGRGEAGFGSKQCQEKSNLTGLYTTDYISTRDPERDKGIFPPDSRLLRT